MKHGSGEEAQRLRRPAVQAEDSIHSADPGIHYPILTSVPGTQVMHTSMSTGKTYTK